MLVVCRPSLRTAAAAPVTWQGKCCACRYNHAFLDRYTALSSPLPTTMKSVTMPTGQCDATVSASGACLGVTWSCIAQMEKQLLEKTLQQVLENSSADAERKTSPPPVASDSKPAADDSQVGPPPLCSRRVSDAVCLCTQGSTDSSVSTNLCQCHQQNEN